MELDQQFRGVALSKHKAELQVPPSNMSSSLRVVFEQRLERDFVEPMFAKSGSKRDIQKQKSQFEDENIGGTLHKNLGDFFYEVDHIFFQIRIVFLTLFTYLCYFVSQVSEVSPPADTKRHWVSQLWRYHDPISYSMFHSLFTLASENSLVTIISQLLGLN